MKSGVEHWLSETKAKEIADVIIKQEKHQFLRIAELGGRIINTAEIDDGPCTEQEIEERHKIKNGEWKCVESKWHERKQKCFCKQEKFKKHKEDEQRKERETLYKPITEEQRKKNGEILKENRKILEDRGILAKKVTIEK